MNRAPVHAGLIAHHGRAGWTGVLIEGPSGSGKSDLALRCLALGLRLVADDRTLLWVSQGRLFGAAPGSIDGLMEARGLGVLRHSALPFAEVGLAVRCLTPSETLERLPDEDVRTLLGVRVPRIALRPLEASAPQKMLHALSLLDAGPKGAI